MCNLYRLHKPAAEVAGFFASIAQGLRVVPGNVAQEVYPGYPALVLAAGQIRPMVWGFPLALKGVRYRPVGAGALLTRNLLIYGLGGIIVPFVGIKAIDLAVTALGLV